MKPFSLVATVVILQLILVVAFILVARSGITTIQESGGLRAGVESLWCGNAGCDDAEGVE